MSIANLEPLVLEQLQTLTLDPTRPLIISDADEVLLQFVAGAGNLSGGARYVARPSIFRSIWQHQTQAEQ